MVNMDLARLTQKRAMLRRKKKIRQAICDTVISVLLIGVIVVGINTFLNAWDREMDSQAEYNREYIQQMNAERMKNGFDPIQ